MSHSKAGRQRSGRGVNGASLPRRHDVEVVIPDIKPDDPDGEPAHHGPGDAITQDTLWTIGHSTRGWEVFLGLLQEACVQTVVDVRRHAGSRRNPQFSPVAMASALREDGIDYLPMPEFGGRRTVGKDSPNTAWRVVAFRGYADYMAMQEFALARERLMQHARSTRVTVMCAEALWWQCHRRLIADDFTARGWQVLHLMASGRQELHQLNVNARIVDDVLRYPSEGDAQAALFQDLSGSEIQIGNSNNCPCRRPCPRSP